MLPARKAYTAQLPLYLRPAKDNRWAWRPLRFFGKARKGVPQCVQEGEVSSCVPHGSGAGAARIDDGTRFSSLSESAMPVRSASDFRAQARVEMYVEWASRARNGAEGHRHSRLNLHFAALAVSLLTAACLADCSTRVPPPRPVPRHATRAVRPGDEFVATAYSLHGRTASGSMTRPGIVAADPSVLPLGSRIRVSDARGYSGTYTVADTGGGIGGRRIDLYIPNHAEARRFGRRTVRVQLLQDASSRAPSGRFHRRLRRAGRSQRRVGKTKTGHRHA